MPTSNKTKAGGKQLLAGGSSQPAPILRGAFVHRMGEDPDDERLAAAFWTDHGFGVEFLENASNRFSRRPDFRLLQNSVPWGYCEVKTLWHHRWTVHILHDDREETRTEMSKKSVEDRIAGDLVTAQRQLQAENSDHKLFNIVLLTNRDPDASLQALLSAMTARSPKARRTMKARRKALLAKEIRQFRERIDLCLWASPASNKKLLMQGCLLFNPVLRSFAKQITGLRDERLISLEPAA